MELVARVTSLCSSGQVTLAVHWLGEVEWGVSTAIGGSLDLSNKLIKCRAPVKSQNLLTNLERVPIEAPGAHKGVEFQSWEATVERKRTKAAVGEVGG